MDKDYIYSVRVSLDELNKAQNLGYDVAEEFRKTLAKLTKTKTCPTCKRPIRSRKNV